MNEAQNDQRSEFVFYEENSFKVENVKNFRSYKDVSSPLLLLLSTETTLHDVVRIQSGTGTAYAWLLPGLTGGFNNVPVAAIEKALASRGEDRQLQVGLFSFF